MCYIITIYYNIFKSLKACLLLSRVGYDVQHIPRLHLVEVKVCTFDVYNRYKSRAISVYYTTRVVCLYVPTLGEVKHEDWSPVLMYQL